MSTTVRLGFVGTGVMGRSMAGHLLRAGHPLAVFNRTASKARPLVEAGAHWCDDLRTLAGRSDIVLTMLGYPADVEATYMGEDGLLAHAQPGMLFIDLTTSCPRLAGRLAGAALAKGCEVLDAPVSGGDVGAREARLSIMVGGSEPAVERARPILSKMGQTIVHQGPAGSGQHCKMANQIAIASGMLGVCEAMAYAQRAGLDPRRVLDSISSGAAGSWSLSNLAPRMLDGNFAPGFYVKHFIKDLGIALDSAAALELELPGLVLARRLYERLAAGGHADEGTQALFRLYSA